MNATYDNVPYYYFRRYVDPDYAGGTWTKTEIGYFKFDLSPLPADAIIDSVKLYACADYTDAGASFDVHLANSDAWSGDTMTWNNQVGFDGGVIDSVITTEQTWVDTWVSWDVTLAAEQEYLGDGVLSLAIQNGIPSTDDYLAQFYSTSNQPELDIYLEVRAVPESARIDVAVGSNQGGQVNGGPGEVGGMAAVFDNVTAAGDFTGLFDPKPKEGLTAPELVGMNFLLSSDPVQMWDVDFTGQFDGRVLLTFGYDEDALAVPEDELLVFHLLPGGPPYVWEELRVDEPEEFHNLDENWIRVWTDSLSPFILGAVPEPATMGLLAISGAALLRRKK
ncbi:MAG: DNRLRE domain-containing protein [Planctomycetota bacterium]|jgi:hypothetical protein